MFFLYQFFVAVIPIIPVLVLAYMANKFIMVFNRKRVIREKVVVINRLTDYFPKRIREKFDSPEILQRFSDKLIKTYKKLFYTVLFYILFWIGYICFIIIRIYSLILNFNRLNNSIEIGYVIGSILMSIMITYWLLFLPIFECFHLKKWFKLDIAYGCCL